MPDTIFALSSGALPAGIAVVRVSGPQAFAALAALTRAPSPPARRTALRTLHGADATPIDRALVVRFAGPASATGEDVVELHVHGGTAVVAAVVAALGAQAGLRLADAGEFTRRAFDNRRLDLSQVEGVADLIAAETEAQRRAALAHADGALRRAVEDWTARLTALRAEAEAALDFADGEDDVAARLGDAGDAGVVALIAAIDAALAQAARGRAVRDGLTVVVSGPPNSGKSSLVNALARRDVALVSPVAGTTRDALEARLDLGGVLVTLVDTAGLRDSNDPVETAGIARARQRAAAADLVLALHGPGGAPGDGQPVRTMIDLDGAPPGRHAGTIGVSSLTGAGMADLEAWLVDWARTAIPAEPPLLANARHVAAAQEARTALGGVIGQSDPVLAAEGLRRAQQALWGISGRVGIEAVLDGIFARFCIGK